MAIDLAALDAKELVLVIVALLGLIPVLTQRTEGSRLFAFGYVFLFFGAVFTNLEHLVLPGILGLLEHVVGMAFAGVLFLYAAYSRRQLILNGGELGEVEDDAEAGAGESGEAV
ncbi:hypothetical protein [Halorarum halobium]|uniref:hypothetical protein n=1 Tax=Halorarum halobium TaxID=3075121 RepID=UPI0028A6AEEC|nr:hypothetical protein [Halobaculum sp. XH14]